MKAADMAVQAGDYDQAYNLYNDYQTNTRKATISTGARGNVRRRPEVPGGRAAAGVGREDLPLDGAGADIFSRAS